MYKLLNTLIPAKHFFTIRNFIMLNTMMENENKRSTRAGMAPHPTKKNLSMCSFFDKSIKCTLLEEVTKNVHENQYCTWVLYRVVCVVNLKLAFTDWFFYNLIILIKPYKIRYRNLDKALLFPRYQIICVKHWKIWRAPTNIKFNIFLLKFCTSFLLNNVYKREFGIFSYFVEILSY